MEKKNTNQTLEALKAELEIAEADQKGLSSKKRSLKKRIAKLEAEHEEVEAEAVSVAVESDADAEGAIVAPFVFEFDDEAEAAPVAVEAESEEAEAEEEAKAKVEAEAKAKAEAAPVAVEAESEEAEAEEEAKAKAEAEAKAKVPANATPIKPKKKKKDSVVLLPILLAFVVVLLAGGLILSCVPFVDSESTQQTENTQQPGATDKPTIPNELAFAMSEFKKDVINITKELTDKDVSAKTEIFVDNKLGEENVLELIEKYNEIPAKEGVAQYVVLATQVKVDQYIAKNGRDYNPNAAAEYSQKKADLTAQYKSAIGQDLNPDGVLAALPGYDSANGNRNALRALIEKSGDTALLTWYNAKMEIYDLMLKQTADTKAVEEYQEEVEQKFLWSDGAIELLEIQLQKVAAGELVVVDTVTNNYTQDYYDFILNNYNYVVVN